jgi:hypothetical protein
VDLLEVLCGLLTITEIDVVQNIGVMRRKLEQR